MNKRIYKYQITVDDVAHVAMPEEAQILTVQTQDDQPFIWALVDADAEPEERTFFIVGTGNPFPDYADYDYIGTFQQANGLLVWHLFEL
jgi:hypothetical protein